MGLYGTISKKLHLAPNWRNERNDDNRRASKRQTSTGHEQKTVKDDETFPVGPKLVKLKFSKKKPLNFPKLQLPLAII